MPFIYLFIHYEPYSIRTNGNSRLANPSIPYAVHIVQYIAERSVLLGSLARHYE